MSVQQRWDTQRERVTAAGRVLTAIFTCTWDDWHNDFVDLPSLGDEWPEDDELVCSDIEVSGLDNVNCVVTATYSSEGPDGRSGRADQAASWRETIDAVMEEQTVTAYYDQSAKAWKAWLNTWTGQGQGYTEENVPDLVVHRPRMTFTLTLFGSVLHIDRVLSNLGKVNTTPFLPVYTAVKAKASASHGDDFSTAVNDTGKWLFAGSRIERVKKSSWRFDFTLIYDSDGWNTQHGVAINVYKGFDMSALLAEMNQLEQDSRGAGAKGAE